MTVLVNINGEIREQSSLNMPAGREFRGAWQFSGAAVEIDMDKAREIQRDKIRAERAPVMQALDVAVIRADEDGDAQAKAKAIAEKKALRDATKNPLLEMAGTPEELKALTLAKLV